MVSCVVLTLGLAAPAMAQQQGMPQQGMQQQQARSTPQRQPMQQGQQQRAQQQRPERTIRNLRAAIQGEANAAHRYDLFANRAEQEGHAQVARLFRAAAVSERIHRRNHEDVLRQLGVAVPNVQPERVNVASTRENLLVPIRGEQQEATQMYPEYIRIAEQEDVPAAVRSFTAARDTETQHDQLFQQALANLGQNPQVEYYAQTDTGMLVMQRPGAVAAAGTQGPSQQQGAIASSGTQPSTQQGGVASSGTQPSTQRGIAPATQPSSQQQAAGGTNPQTGG